VVATPAACAICRIAASTCSPPAATTTLPPPPRRRRRSFNAKLADFGAAREVAIDMTANVGTPLYRAPETMTATQVTRYDASSDMYAAGLVVWAVMHLQHNPFPHYTKALDLARGVLTGERPPIDDALFAFDGGARLKQLMQAMWQGDPAARPTAQQALDELEAIGRVAGVCSRAVDTPGSHPVTLLRYGDMAGRTPATGLSSLGAETASRSEFGGGAGAGGAGAGLGAAVPHGGSGGGGGPRRGALESSGAGASSAGRTVASFEVDAAGASHGVGRTAGTLGRTGASGGVRPRGEAAGAAAGGGGIGSIPSSLVAVNDGLAGLGLGSRARANLYAPPHAAAGGRDSDDDAAQPLTAVAAAVASPFADNFGGC
jgi:hypothetical protein